MNLRPYQTTAINHTREAFKNSKRVVLCLPTGAGKSMIFSTIARITAENGKRVLILTHRLELKTQAEGYGNNGDAIQVVMVETFYNRVKREAVDTSSFDLVIIDEAHIGNFSKIIEALPESVYVIGATATPISKPKMRTWYHDIVCPIGISELIEQGYLARPQLYVSKAVSGADIEALPVKGGEFAQHGVDALFSKPAVLDGVVNDYMEREAFRRKTIIFCSSIATTELLVQALQDRLKQHEDGYCVTVFNLHSKRTAEARKNIVEMFTMMQAYCTLVNCGIATTGFDVPDIEIVIINRATLSLPLWLQMVGRGSRVTAKKQSFEYWDYGNNAARLGHWNQRINWKQVFFEPERLPKAKGMKSSKQCPECGAFLVPTAKACKYCDYEFPKREKNVLTGELVAVEYADVARLNGKMLFDLTIEELAQYIQYKGYKSFFFEVVLHFSKRNDELQAYWKAKGWNWGYIKMRKEWLGRIQGIANKKIEI